MEIRTRTPDCADCARRVASPRHPGGGSPKRLLQAASALALAVVFATHCDSTGAAKTLGGSRPASPLAGTGFYASPTGSRSAGGSLSDPWDLQTAFDRPLPPGSTLWLRGGIPGAAADGFEYEVRNRVTLCRCGQSQNKPFCDGTHAAIKFRDE